MPQFLWSAEVQAFVPIESARGGNGNIPEALLLGYSVFTSFRFPCGRAFLEQHQVRLKDHADQVGITLPVWPQSELLTALLQTQQPEGMSPEETSITVRLTVYPDLTGGIQSLLSQPTLSGCLLLSIQPFVALRQSQVLKTVDYTRPYPQIKQGGLLHELRLKRQVRSEKGNALPYTEVLWVNAADELTEVTTANIFLAFQGEKAEQLIWKTPPASVCLSGLVREKLCLQAGSQEACIHRNALAHVQAAFLSNSVQGLMPVSHIEDRALPWPILAQKQFEGFQTRVKTACFNLEV